MAGEVLKSAQGLLAGFPDNVSGQISAVDSRNFVISAVNGIGAFDHQAQFILPMTDGVPTILNPALTPIDVVGNFFTLDGNNAWIPDYGSAIINPGTVRLVDFLGVFVADQVGGGLDTYNLQVRVGGVPINTPIPNSVSGAAERFFIQTEFAYDVQIGGAIDLSVTPVGTNDDLDISFAYQRVNSQLI